MDDGKHGGCCYNIGKDKCEGRERRGKGSRKGEEALVCTQSKGNSVIMLSCQMLSCQITFRGLKTCKVCSEVRIKCPGALVKVPLQSISTYVYIHVNMPGYNCTSTTHQDTFIMSGHLCTCTYTHAHTHIHTIRHIYTHTIRHIHTYNQAHTHIQSGTYTHTIRHIHTYTYTHTIRHIYTCTYTHTIQAHTHMHIHSGHNQLHASSTSFLRFHSSALPLFTVISL